MRLLIHKYSRGLITVQAATAVPATTTRLDCTTVPQNMTATPLKKANGMYQVNVAIPVTGINTTTAQKISRAVEVMSSEPMRLFVPLLRLWNRRRGIGLSLIYISNYRFYFVVSVVFSLNHPAS